MQIEIPYQTYTVIAEAKNTLELPLFYGATIRGGLGYVLKEFTCTNKKLNTCSSCYLIQKCRYSFLFEAVSKVNGAGQFFFKQGEKIPPPFVIESTLANTKVVQKGSSFSFSFTLFGEAIKYLTYFAYGFEQLGKLGLGGKGGKYCLKAITVDNGDTSVPVYQDGVLQAVENKIFKLSIDTDNCEKLNNVKLCFDTPVRIKINGKLMTPDDFNFLKFFASLLRRLSCLLYFYCGKQVIDIEEVKHLIQLAETVKVNKKNLHWFDLSRYSTRQKSKVKLGGFVGHVTLNQVPVPAYEILKAGKIIHISKNASFGLGKISLICL